MLGAKRFDRIRRRYLDDCPSESFTMRNLGRHLAAWMERNQALVGANFEIALDMARLEWAEIESFDAAEHERLSPADIAALEPDEQAASAAAFAIDGSRVRSGYAFAGGSRTRRSAMAARRAQ